MQEKHLFEYAIIRIVPRVEREEFVNAGVILFCPSRKFLKAKFELLPERVRSLYNDVDLADIVERLDAFQLICAGDPLGGPISKLSIASRFRWLASPRSTIVQISPIHSGLCHDPDLALDRLIESSVL